MTRFTSPIRDVINVYRSRGANTYTFKEDIRMLIDMKRNIVIVGDFNICYRKNANHEIFKMLHNLGFQQLVKDPTHIEDGTIDLVFSMCPDTISKYEVRQQAQCFLDHDILSVR